MYLYIYLLYIMVVIFFFFFWIIILIDVQKLLKSILKNVVYLQTDIKHLSMKQTEILLKIDEINSKNQIALNNTSNSELIDNKFTFPINDKKYLDSIEEDIVDANIRTSLVCLNSFY